MEVAIRKAETREEKAGSGHASFLYLNFFLFTACCLLTSVLALPQQSAAPAQAKQAETPRAPGVNPEEEEAPLPGDWAPELLDAILSSPNSEAAEALYHAVFAAGPRIVSKLTEALKDDRTAEFAAQSLAFIGGEQALEVLWKLVTDPRDLNLRRFYYGALGEYDSPQATDVLFDVISKSDSEPDRTVTEAAILALTVRSDPKLSPRIRDVKTKIQDVVIRDDLDNAWAVVESRAKYLASPAGKNAGGSIEEAVRTYFIPALEPPAPSEAAASTSRRKTAAEARPTSHASPEPPVSVKIRNLTLFPDKARALARVTFEDSSAIAQYDIVLQKRFGDWRIASVWLGSEVEKPPPTAPSSSRKN